MRILITGGATREPIDSVRFITNMSTGRTSAALADEFTARGHEVVLLTGQGAVTPSRMCELARYSDFRDLDCKLKQLLSGAAFDLVIHAAAVSDYSVSEVRGESGAPLVRAGKLASGGKLTIGLTPNFKIISRLAEYARPHSPKIVGFKLTDSAEQRLREEAIRTVLTHPGVELVVHNDLSEIQAASHPFTLVSRGGERRRALGAVALASAIEEWLS